MTGERLEWIEKQARRFSFQALYAGELLDGWFAFCGEDMLRDSSGRPRLFASEAEALRGAVLKSELGITVHADWKISSFNTTCSYRFPYASPNGIGSHVRLALQPNRNPDWLLHWRTSYAVLKTSEAAFLLALSADEVLKALASKGIRL